MILAVILPRCACALVENDTAMASTAMPKNRRRQASPVRYDWNNFIRAEEKRRKNLVSHHYATPPAARTHDARKSSGHLGRTRNPRPPAKCRRPTHSKLI